jgi:chromosome segregation ATPase
MKKNTKIESQLLEMIQPRIELIEKKFAKNEALTDQDVITLIVKSQSNHISHLDQRLDDVAADIAQLRNDFTKLIVKFATLEARFEALEAKFEALEAKFEALEAKFDALETKINARFETLEAKIEAKIEQTINKNIRWFLGIITFSLTLIKIIDLLIGN